MQVHINEIASTVRTVEGSAVLSPAQMQEIIRLVLKAIEEREAHGQRVNAERKVTSGVRDEMEGEA
ncbi:MAG: hypothetical protein ACRD3C_16885 [Vicinamibacterales bacterium]